MISILASAGAAWMSTRPNPPAVVHLANSSPFIAPSLIRTFQVQFMPPLVPA
jgi:hypothetical protein